MRMKTMSQDRKKQAEQEKKSSKSQSDHHHITLKNDSQSKENHFK